MLVVTILNGENTLGLIIYIHYLNESIFLILLPVEIIFINRKYQFKSKFKSRPMIDALIDFLNIIKAVYAELDKYKEKPKNTLGLLKGFFGHSKAHPQVAQI